MSQKRCDLVRRHSACDHRIETRRSDASYEAARPKSVREDAPVPVPEFLSNFDAQALGRCQERLRLGAAQFLRDQRQHLGVDPEQTVESDVFARQRSGLRIIGFFVMDRLPSPIRCVRQRMCLCTVLRRHSTFRTRRARARRDRAFVATRRGCAPARHRRIPAAVVIATLNT
jgi:hypothetical protein